MPPALSIGIWMSAIGLPVWAGHLRVCLFVILFVRTDFVAAHRPQFLRYGDEIVQAHCPGGGIDTFEKNLGVGPPWGKFFPQNF